MLTSPNIRSAADRTLHIEPRVLAGGVIGTVEDGYYQIRVYNSDFTIEFEIMSKQIVSVRSKKSTTNQNEIFRLGISDSGVIALDVNTSVNIDVEYSSSLIKMFEGTAPAEGSMIEYAFDRFYTNLDMSVGNISVDQDLQVNTIRANIIDADQIVLGDWVFSKKTDGSSELTISIKNNNQS